MNSTEPLINPYLWAVGTAAATILPGSEVAGRYRVIAPQIWLDTQPQTPLPTPEVLPKELLPYQYLYPQRLHLPVVYGLCETEMGSVLLLENAPLEGAGNLLPQLQAVLPHSATLRQVSWFWQLLQLWIALETLGVAASLLYPENLYVEAGLIRLRELYAEVGPEHSPLGSDLTPEGRYAYPIQPTLQEFGDYWLTWIPQFQPEIQPTMVEIGQQLRQEGVTIDTVTPLLNTLLLQLTSQSPLRLEVFGLTDTGPQCSHNEDTCYPLPQDLQNRSVPPDSQLIPHVAIVCDGIGGHDGGEVASQLAIRSLKLQLQALLSEINQSDELLLPDVVMEQIAASIRVVNNLMNSQNDAQGRQDRRRMGTTLVMALHLQQTLPETGQVTHELYLAQVGDSRAYWITPRHCQCLTVDDDLAGREVRLGRSFYRDILQRPDAHSLTQALGTRSGAELYLQTQRFVIEEDGVLLLCSDGLSDYGWVEKSWGESVVSVLNSTKSLEIATRQWIELANEKNGHDNVSVVLMRCRISPDYPVLLDSTPSTSSGLVPLSPAEALTAASAALLAETAHQEPLTAIPMQAKPVKGRLWIWIVAVLLVLGLVGTIGFLMIRQRSTLPDPPQEQQN
jgi:protein phosphatase